MKKLIIAMSAATMAVLCAQAEVPEGYISGIDFQKTALGNLKVKAPDVTDGPVLWATTATLAEDGTVESTVVAESEETNANRFLKIDETVPLQRLVNTEPTNVVAGIEISSRVQFTAADEAPKPDDGDKLLVWMQAAADAEGTKDEPGYKPAKKAGVMVTDATGTTMIKELAASEVEAFTAAWHTLVIESTVTGEEGLETLAFKVTLDGVVADKTFVSRVDSTDTFATTISSIGFQGTGAVDDIGFKALAAAVPVDVTLSLGQGVVLFTEDLETQIEDKVTGIPGKTVTVYAEGAAEEYTVSEGAVVTDGEGDFAGFAVITITVAKDLTVTITKGEAPTPPTPIQPSIDPAAGQVTISIRAATSSVAEAAAIDAIKAPSGVDAATYKTYFMATAVAEQDGSYTVTVGLNPDVVTPAVVDDANLDIAAGAITVSSKAGLYYSLVKGTTLSTITNVVDTQAGTGTVLKLVDSTMKGDAAFYKVSVTAVTPATTETTEE